MKSIKMLSTSSPNSDVAQSCRWAASTSLRTSASSTQVGDDLSASDTIRTARATCRACSIRPSRAAASSRERALRSLPPTTGLYAPCGQVGRCLG